MASLTITEVLLQTAGETARITGLVFVMMTLVDLVNLWTKGRLSSFLKNGPRARQYITVSFISSMPGCFGAFTNVSLYTHGVISLGALTGAMAAASGDEALVLLALVPKTAVLLIVLLFIAGVAIGWIADLFIRKSRFRPCLECLEQGVHPGKSGFRHYLHEHIWNHILKKHLWKTALWTFGAMLIISLGTRYFHFGSFPTEHPLLLLFIAAVMGLIPQSGPHMIFVTLYAGGMIPFSVLFTSAFVQDGHGMLPMLSFSVRDSVFLKLINLISGLLLGLFIHLIGY